MKTIVCIASGSSLRQSDVDYCRRRASVLVVNNNYQRAPWADYLYAADVNWWWMHEANLATFSGEKWTCDAFAAHRFGLHRLPIEDMPEGGGENGGFQGLDLATRLAPRVLLLGYDMGATGHGHWHADHEPPLGNPLPHVFARWRAAFAAAAPLWNTRAEIVNCTRETALDCFPLAAIHEVL